MSLHSPPDMHSTVLDPVAARDSARESPRQMHVSAQVPGTDIRTLTTSEVRYRRLFEAARDGILLLDAQTGRITDANPFMVELLGYPLDELLGKELWQIGLFSDKESSQAAFDVLQRDRYIRYDDLPLESKGGQKRDVEFVSNVYREGDTNVIQCNIRDITARMQTERDLASHQAELKVMNARLHSAMMEAHHRVKNNLQVVAGMLDMAVMDEPEQIRPGTVRRIGASVRAMALVHDMLTERSRADAEGDAISSERLILGLIELLRQSAATGTISVQIKDKPLSSRRATSLALVLTELIYNAFKHGAGEVSVGFDGIMLSVRDDGPGFPEGFDAERDCGTGLELVLALNKWDLGGRDIRFWNCAQGGAGVELTVGMAIPAI